jgi:two-component system cell cycle sensor histidine kinase/response regulator CckA
MAGRRSATPVPLMDGTELDLRDFFEKALDHVCVAGFDGYFKHLSASWSKTLGWTAEELMSKPSLEFVHPEDRARTLAGRSQLHDGRELSGLVNRYVCKDGQVRWFEWRSVADAQRAVVYCVARDVTEQKHAEARLEQAKSRQQDLERQLVFADRMASVGTLAAGVAHEINNPLSFVVANLSMMLERLQHAQLPSSSALVEELMQLTNEAILGSERIRKTVLALKTFSRSEAEERAVLDVHPLLELSISMTFNEIRHRARLVRDYGSTPLVEVDAARLGQVFVNLLVNAAQAIPEDGATTHQIRVVTSTDALGRAVIEVRDTGPGVPKDLVERIFDPFFTTKPVGIGTGLGLSVSHSIVTALGGAISVVDSHGRGGAFRVVLPAASATKPGAPVEAAPAAPLAVAAPLLPPVAAVLVVDDEPAIGATLRRVLAGHDVTVVTRAKDALGLLDSGASFDVILSDVMMPEMSGLDFYMELSKRFADHSDRVVFISGGAFTPATRASLERTGNLRIDKPFEPRHIRDVVQRFVAHRQSRGGAT